MTKGISPSYNSALKRANKITFRFAKRLWLISYFMGSKSVREISFLCHSYLRWVDDFIDISEETYSIKKKFLERQKHLVDQLLKENYETQPRSNLISCSMSLQDQKVRNRIVITRSYIENNLLIVMAAECISCGS